jgi:Trypsin
MNASTASSPACPNASGYFGGKVLVGAYKSGSTEGGAQWKDVKSPMQVHPDFDLDYLINDVMLFKIAPTNLTPVELNTDPSDPVPGVNLTTAGFGIKRSDVPLQPRYLQKVTVQSLANDVCNTLWKYVDPTSTFQPEVMTCSIGINPDGSPMGPCQGTETNCMQIPTRLAD